MPTFTLERAGAKHLRFTGELLAAASSREATSERWTDPALYRTAGNTYVVSVIGRTTHEGEIDRHAAHIAARPAGMLQGLQRRDGTLTNLAKHLLEDAANSDAAFVDTLIEDLD